jgi:hypothetical protein
MKIIFALIFLLIIKFSFASAISPMPLTDTTVKKEYKRNRNEFLDRYGHDDSSRALINFYFHRRGLVIGNLSAGIPFTLLSGIALFPATAAENSNGNGLGTALLFPILFTGVMLILVGSYLWIRYSHTTLYSRKRLLILLDDYFNGKSIPWVISKNKVFKAILWSKLP